MLRWYAGLGLLLTALAAALPSRADRDIVSAARYYHRPGSRLGLSHTHLYRVNPDGSRLTQLTRGSAEDAAPQWSPDGRLIAFIRQAYEPRCTIRVCDARGGHQRVLMRPGASWEEVGCAWSPDSHTVALMLGRYHSTEDWHAETWLIDVDSGRRRRLPDVSQVAWSPDGRLRYDSYQVYTKRHLPPDRIVRVAGGSPATAATAIVDPVWLDNRTVIGKTYGSSKDAFVILGADGRERRRILTHDAEPLFMRREDDEGAWSSLERVPGAPGRVACSKSDYYEIGGGRHHKYFVLDTRGAGSMKYVREGMCFALAPDGRRFSSVPGTDLGAYGSRRSVYVAPLRIGNLKGGGRTIVSGLVWVQGVDWRRGAPARRRAFVPAIGRFAGFRLGRDSVDDMERMWGHGRIAVGGHPGSARQSRVRGTDWVVYADGFYYRLDTLMVTRGPAEKVSPSSGQPIQLARIPYAAVRAARVRFMGRVSLGMRMSTAIRLLRGIFGRQRREVVRGRIPYTDVPADEALSWEASGRAPITPRRAFRNWAARLYFRRNVLVAIRLGCDE